MFGFHGFSPYLVLLLKTHFGIFYMEGGRGLHRQAEVALQIVHLGDFIEELREGSVLGPVFIYYVLLFG